MKKRLSVSLIFLITFSMLTAFSPEVRAQGTPEQLTTNSYRDHKPSWSPDGTKIAYHAFSGSWYRHIWVMNSDGSGMTQLTSGNIVDEGPAFSPDGTKIVFMRWGLRGDYFDLMLMNADGVNVQRLTFSAIPGKAAGSYANPRWSQDGLKLIFHYGEGTTGTPWEQQNFWICTMKPDGTDLEVLGSGMYPNFVLGDAKILFNTKLSPSTIGRIAIMNADGTGIEYLTDGPCDHHPDMSALSHRIVFTCCPAFGQPGDLYVMNQDGYNLVPLVSDGKNNLARWSPDEKYVAYTSETSGNWDIWRLSVCEVVTLPWRDDFDYQAKQEMKDACWTIINEGMMTVGGGVVILDNDGTISSAVYYIGNFPSGVYDFKVETKGMWIGRSYGNLQVSVITERHGYRWMLDGYYPEYSFIRDDVKVQRFGGYTPQKDVLMTIGVEKKGNTFFLYHNGELKSTYVDPDETPDALVGVGIKSGWISTTEYDYILVEEVTNEPPIAAFGYRGPETSFKPSTIYVGSTVKFDAELSSDPDGIIVSYSWDFGDGATATETDKVVHHPYLTSGPYTVTLVVTDDKGATDEITKDIFIHSLKWEIYFEVDYMTGHRPTDSVLEYIHRYFRDNGIYVYFFVHDEISPADPSVTVDEFWQYEATYNDVWRFDDRAHGNETTGRYNLKEKWVLYGTVWAENTDEAGHTVTPNDEYGNYIFIADQANDDWAHDHAIYADEAETVALMHEMGHTIGILLWDRPGTDPDGDGTREDYDNVGWSVMAEMSIENCIADPKRYSQRYWRLNNVEENYEI